MPLSMGERRRSWSCPLGRRGERRSGCLPRRGDAAHDRLDGVMRRDENCGASRELAISAIIPAFNEEGRTGRVVSEAKRRVDEVLVINDHSSDGTALEAERAGARVLSNQCEKGYVGSIRTGFHHASGDILVTLDADGEHDPADISRLIRPIVSGKADVVLGRRPSIPRPSERAINWVARRRVPHIHDTGTGYRALRGDVMSRLRLIGRCTCGTFVLEAVARGARCAEIPVRIRPPATTKRRTVQWGHGCQLLHVVRLALFGAGSPWAPSP